MTATWDTPDNSTSGYSQFIVRVPNNYQFRALLFGAICLLCDPESWTKKGNATPDDMEKFWEVFVSQLYEDIGIL